MTAHLIRSKQKICRPHDYPPPPRGTSAAKIAGKPTARGSSTTRCLGNPSATTKYVRMHTRGRPMHVLSWHNTRPAQPTASPYLHQWLAAVPASSPASPQGLRSPAVLQTCWTPISIGPRVNLLLLADTVVPSAMGLTMSYSRSAARVRGQLCRRTSLTRSCLPNEPT